VTWRAGVLFVTLVAVACALALRSVPPARPPCVATDTGIVVEVDDEGTPTGRAVGVVGCMDVNE
jgi:hypothetical protein